LKSRFQTENGFFHATGYPGNSLSDRYGFKPVLAREGKAIIAV